MKTLHSPLYGVLAESTADSFTNIDGTHHVFHTPTGLRIVCHESNRFLRDASESTRTTARYHHLSYYVTGEPTYPPAITSRLGICRYPPDYRSPLDFYIRARQRPLPAHAIPGRIFR